MLHVRDKNGVNILMAFHDHQCGKIFAKACKPGRTVAVLDTDLHLFLDLQFGLRIEEHHVKESKVKVLPFGLKALLQANDIAVKAGGKDGNCWQCGKAGGKLKKCSQCGTPYCKKVGFCGERSLRVENFTLH